MISSTTNRNDYIGNGVAQNFAYQFYIFAKTDLLVTLRDPDDVETTLVVDTDYIVTDVGSAAGGNVILVQSGQEWLDAYGNLLADYKLTIRRVRPLKQETDLRNQGSFFAETHEAAYDHGIMIAQQQQDELTRAVKTPETVPTTEFNPELPGDIATANRLIVTNSDGDGWDSLAMDSVSQIVVQGKILYVDAAAGDDGNSGTYSNPFATISKAVSEISMGANGFIFLEPQQNHNITGPIYIINKYIQFFVMNGGSSTDPTKQATINSVASADSGNETQAQCGRFQLEGFAGFYFHEGVNIQLPDSIAAYPTGWGNYKSFLEGYTHINATLTAYFYKCAIDLGNAGADLCKAGGYGQYWHLLTFYTCDITTHLAGRVLNFPSGGLFLQGVNTIDSDNYWTGGVVTHSVTGHPLNLLTNSETVL